MPRRCTSTPGSRRPWRCTSRGTRSTTTPTCAARRGPRRGASARSTRTRSRTTTTSSAASRTPIARIRQKAIDHHFECIDIMNETGSRDLKIWLADGTNYPGQDDMRGRQDRLADSLQKIYARIGEDQRLVLEYKFFEPAFYHTDVPDWGTSYAQVAALGDRAHGLPRHRPPRARARTSSSSSCSCCASASSARSTSTRASTPTTTSSSARPTRSSCSASSSRWSAAAATATTRDVAFMLDQCHNIEDKIPGQIRSVLNVQEMTARALLVDRDALDAAQARRRRARGERHPDGCVLHRRARAARRLARDRAACRATRWRRTSASGYGASIAADRVGGNQAGWGA